MYNNWKMACTERKSFPTGGSIAYIGEREGRCVDDEELSGRRPKRKNSWSAKDSGRESGREQERGGVTKEKRALEMRVEKKEYGENSMEKN